MLAEAEGDARSTDTVVLLASVGDHIGVAAVVLSWTMVNTVFAFRYARLYCASW
ncbi:hypothetical protein GWI34_07110 [Actinomadura sp. DSM 109109]|nr:hypothetical protein [Actinomadura lepetitiana]